MNDLQEIEVVIDRFGNIVLHVQGVKGPHCRDLTEGLEEALGGELIGRTHTSEYDEKPAMEREYDWLKQSGS